MSEYVSDRDLLAWRVQRVPRVVKRAVDDVAQVRATRRAHSHECVLAANRTDSETGGDKGLSVFDSYDNQPVDGRLRRSVHGHSQTGEAQDVHTVHVLVGDQHRVRAQKGSGS